MEFRKSTLGELCNIVTDYVANGSFKSLAENVKYENKESYARVIRLVDYNNNYSIKDSIWVDQHGYEYLKKTRLYGDEVIITNVGANLGTVFVAPRLNKHMTLGPNAIMLKSKENDQYLYYWLISQEGKNKVKAIVTGSAMPKFNKTDLKNIEILVPNIETQNKIVNILSKIDDKIELNTQINDNLYEICKNLYKNYFTDKVDIKWQVDKLGNYLTVDRGLSYKGKFLSDAGIPMINLGNVMPNGTFRIEKNKYYIGEYKDKVTAKVGDIVIANTDMTQNREVIGTPVIIPPLYDNDIIFSHHIYCLRNLKLPKMYLFYTLLTDEWNGVAGGNATGTTVLALPKETIENYKIYIPDESTLNNFENVAMKIQQQRDNILLENINLEKLRDTLLPKLMNGEIDLDKIEI